MTSRGCDSASARRERIAMRPPFHALEQEGDARRCAAICLQKALRRLTERRRCAGVVLEGYLSSRDEFDQMIELLSGEFMRPRNLPQLLLLRCRLERMCVDNKVQIRLADFAGLPGTLVQCVSACLACYAAQAADVEQDVWDAIMANRYGPLIDTTVVLLPDQAEPLSSWMNGGETIRTDTLAKDGRVVLCVDFHAIAKGTVVDRAQLVAALRRLDLPGLWFWIVTDAKPGTKVGVCCVMDGTDEDIKAVYAQMLCVLNAFVWRLASILDTLPNDWSGHFRKQAVRITVRPINTETGEFHKNHKEVAHLTGSDSSVQVRQRELREPDADTPWPVAGSGGEAEWLATQRAEAEAAAAAKRSAEDEDAARCAAAAERRAEAAKRRAALAAAAGKHTGSWADDTDDEDLVHVNGEHTTKRRNSRRREGGPNRQTKPAPVPAAGRS